MLLFTEFDPDFQVLLDSENVRIDECGNRQDGSGSISIINLFISIHISCSLMDKDMAVIGGSVGGVAAAAGIVVRLFSIILSINNE